MSFASKWRARTVRIGYSAMCSCGEKYGMTSFDWNDCVYVAAYVCMLVAAHEETDGLRCEPQQSQHCAIFYLKRMYAIAVWMSFHEFGMKKSNDDYNGDNDERSSSSTSAAMRDACLINQWLYSKTVLKCKTMIVCRFWHVLRVFTSKWLALPHKRNNNRKCTLAHLFNFSSSIVWMGISLSLSRFRSSYLCVYVCARAWFLNLRGTAKNLFVHIASWIQCTSRWLFLFSFTFRSNIFSVCVFFSFFLQ